MAKKLQPLHWFPLDTDRWLGELAGGLTAEQKGGLLDLLSTAWTQVPPCTLPDDNAYLASRSGLGSRWKRNRDAVLARFAPTDNARLVCGWLLEVYNEQFTKYTNRSEANRENIRKRVRPPIDTEAPTNSTRNRSTNRRQNTEGEGAVLPDPKGSRVVLAPAPDDALAPAGAAPRDADANDDDFRPATDAEHTQREDLARIGLRPADIPPKNGHGNPDGLRNLDDLLKSDTDRAREAREVAENAAQEQGDRDRENAAAVLAARGDRKAQRKALEDEYHAKVSDRYDAWAQRRPEEAARHEARMLETFKTPPGEMHPTQKRLLRKCVLSEWRKLAPQNKAIPEMEAYVAERERELATASHQSPPSPTMVHA